MTKQLTLGMQFNLLFPKSGFMTFVSKPIGAIMIPEMCIRDRYIAHQPIIYGILWVVEKIIAK